MIKEDLKMAAKKVAQTEKSTEELKQEVATLQQEVKELEEAQGSDAQPAVVEEKKSLKDRVKDGANNFGVKHPKLTKAGKAFGLAVVGIVGGVVGYALGRDSVDQDLVEKMMDNDDDVDIID